MSVSNLKTSIENSKKVSLQKFIYSIGIRHIGMENARLISSNVKSINKLLEIIRKNQLDKFLNIDGIGETQLNSLRNFFSKNKNLLILNDLNSILNIQDQNFQKKGILRNKTFMFTGKLDGISRAEAKSLIEKNSGSTLSNVSKNLDFLVAGEKPTKSKLDQATKLGIKILSQDELKKLLDQTN